MKQLIPKDSLTRRFLVEVLAKMYEYHIQKETAVATSEFPRSDVPTAGPQSTQTDSTNVIVSSQYNEKELLQPNPNNKNQSIKQTSQSSTCERG